MQRGFCRSHSTPQAWHARQGKAFSTAWWWSDELDRISCSTSAVAPAFALVSIVVVALFRHDQSHFETRDMTLGSDIEDLGARLYLGGCLSGVVVAVVCGRIVSVDWTGRKGLAMTVGDSEL